MFSVLKNLFKRTQSIPVHNISFIVFGIGNKGRQYHNTRHNIGFCAVDALLIKCVEKLREKCCSSEIAVGRLPYGETAVIAKPQTFVNRSGIAIKELLKRYNLSLSSCLVIVDDFNLPLGVLRFRRRGTDGGHKGLQSIISEVGNDFPRLRIGTGPLPEDIEPVDFVLGSFDEHEIEKKNEVVKKAAEAILFFCKNGIDEAMNMFNK